MSTLAEDIYTASFAEFVDGVQVIAASDVPGIVAAELRRVADTYEIASGLMGIAKSDTAQVASSVFGACADDLNGRAKKVENGESGEA